MTPRYLLKPARLAGSPLLATQSDDRLVDLVRAGSEPAFDAIVSRYRGPLLRYCAAIVGSTRAEDVVQQAFLNAFAAMQGSENDLNLKPWLYRIAHNASLNALRDRALRDEALDQEQPAADPPDRVVERRDQLAAVFAAVESLPPRQRDAIVLRELEGRSYEEIATALGVGGGSVRALLNRARNSVRIAATAITPVGLLLRIPPAGSEAGEDVAARVAELTAGVGVGAATTKVAATVLVTGAVAGGVALGPGQDDGDPAKGQEPRNAPGTRAVPAPDLEESTDEGDDDGTADDGGSSGSSRERDGEGGDRSGPSERSGPGDGDLDAVEDNSGPGSLNSGPGSGSDNSGPGSDSSGPGSDGSGTSGSGDSGSGSGDSGSGSGSSGSGSGSGTSGGDSSGSGSGSSGSGSGSDSGSSGSGSGDGILDGG